MPNYDIYERIYHSNNTEVFPGQSLLAHQPVIIKTDKSKYPSLEEITLLKHEYQIAKNLEIEGIVKLYRLENYQNGLALVVEYFAAPSLLDFIKSEKIEIIEFLQIAIKLAQTLT